MEIRKPTAGVNRLYSINFNDCGFELSARCAECPDTANNGRYMLRILSSIACYFVATAAGFASCAGSNVIDSLPEATVARLDRLVAAHPYPEGNLWLAKKPGSTVTVVGTVHIPDPRLDQIVAAITPRLREADLLILEVNTETEKSMMRLMVEQPDTLFITEGPSLIDLLSEEDWALLSKDLAARGVPTFMAAKFQPWFMAMMISIPVCALEAMQSGAAGFDKQLEAIAGYNGVPTAALDTPDVLFEIFGDEPMEDQLAALRASLSVASQNVDMIATTLDSYFSGRHREFWELARITMEDIDVEGAEGMFNEMEQSLLIERNQKWAPIIAGLVPGKTVVLAIGAAHLSGETGMLRSLEKLGYQLSPL